MFILYTTLYYTVPIITRQNCYTTPVIISLIFSNIVLYLLVFFSIVNYLLNVFANIIHIHTLDKHSYFKLILVFFCIRFTFEIISKVI